LDDEDWFDREDANVLEEGFAEAGPDVAVAVDPPFASEAICRATQAIASQLVLSFG